MGQTNNFSEKNVRVRFGPSPTGFLHIGSARTTLFNWFFAQKYGGKFILRVEDTDKERSKKEYEEDIMKGLRWLGLNWDEGPDIGGQYGPYRQSERLKIYKKYLEKFLEQRNVYYCFCSKEELENEKKEALSHARAWTYSGRCRKFSFEEAREKIKNGENAVLRLKMPEKIIEFNDLIRGPIKFDGKLIGDIIIAKDLTEPLYNFSVAIDDFEMKISHVIRGEDHLANTAKQLIIFEVLGVQSPQYAHLPLILAADRSKMSKRYMETSLNEYKDKGYLPEAIVNFLALLGWHPIADASHRYGAGPEKKEQEVFSREELTEKFSIERVQKAGAVFNIEKLDWLNGVYIRNMPTKDLAERIKNFIPAEWGTNNEFLIKILEIEKERLKTLVDFKDLAGFFFALPDYSKELLVWKKMTLNEVKNNLNLIKSALEKISEKEFNVKNNINAALAPLAQQYGNGEIFWPMRVALSGAKASPGPIEIAEILGKKESLRRIEIAAQKL